MGTDIHAFIEVKENDTWHGIEYLLDRNYRLFAFMAGVRSDGTIEAIVEPRGFPLDASEEAKLEYPEGGYDPCGLTHTPSWINLEEAKKIDMSTGENISFCMSNATRLFEAVEDVRLVFWFS